MLIAHLSALVLACAAPPLAAGQAASSMVAEPAGAASIAHAFAVESLVLMAGELRAAIDAADDDLVAASPFLDLIYARYSARGDLVSATLRQESRLIAGSTSPAAVAPPDAAEIARFRRLPDETLTRIVGQRFSNEDSEALALAARLGLVLHEYTRSLAGAGDTAPAASLAEARTRALAVEFADVLERLVEDGDSDQQHSIGLVTDAVLASPDEIRAQVAALPEPGGALTVAYAGTLRLLSEDIGQAEFRLQAAGGAADQARTIADLQPALVGLAERAHLIGLALSSVRPDTLSPDALAEQRNEISHLIDLTALAARLDQRAP